MQQVIMMSVFLHQGLINKHNYDDSKALITSWPPGYTETNDIKCELVYHPGKITDLPT